jgi:hypothetical protein
MSLAFATDVSNRNVVIIRAASRVAGQWVEPGGGVPTVVMSGRQVVELMCHDAGEPFVAR